VVVVVTPSFAAFAPSGSIVPPKWPTSATSADQRDLGQDDETALLDAEVGAERWPAAARAGAAKSARTRMR